MNAPALWREYSKREIPGHLLLRVDYFPGYCQRKKMKSGLGRLESADKKDTKRNVTLYRGLGSALKCVEVGQRAKGVV